MLGVIMGFDGLVLGLAIGIIPATIAILVAIRWAKNDDYTQHRTEVMFCIAAVLFCAAPFLIVFPICATTGLHPTYAMGVREGYITKIEMKGLIWKTCEVEVQIGTGKLAALQEPWKFSLDLRHEDDYNDLCANMGKRVLIAYREWLLMPYHIGSSGYGILKVIPRGVEAYSVKE